MEKSFFITGTDTGAGKTWSTLALMHYFKQQGLSVVGMKPVAAGCEWIDGQLKNEDALLLQKHSSVELRYEDVNPYAFEAPVSPHLAGIENPVQLDVILQAFDYLKSKAEVIVVEGAGGWLAPINRKADIADLAKQLNVPVIMVVAIRLGCINHARLTYQAIQESNVECAGWLAVCVDPAMKKQTENIETIMEALPVPMLGVLPYIEEMDLNKLASNLIDRKLI